MVLPEPTVTPSPGAVEASAPPGMVDVHIACVFFDGLVPTSESDEYVEITNAGDQVASLDGWSLSDIADGAPTFVFPETSIEPGDSIRVYTDEIHPESGGLSFGRGTSIWNNGNPDEAGLFDASGALVSQMTYPPGCETSA